MLQGLVLQDASVMLTLTDTSQAEHLVLHLLDQWAAQQR
jgi:hypothetical protein